MYGNHSIHYATYLLKIVNGVFRFGLTFRSYRVLGYGLYIPIRLNNCNVQLLFETTKYLTFFNFPVQGEKKTIKKRANLCGQLATNQILYLL